MKLIGELLIGFVAFIHLYILWLEMFAWQTKGKKVFKGALAPELFAPTRVMAANQGLYNGFLAAGLIWSLIISDEAWSVNVALFFLCCVAVAGVYGAITASKKILFVQTVPACITILLLLM